MDPVTWFLIWLGFRGTYAIYKHKDELPSTPAEMKKAGPAIREIYQHIFPPAEVRARREAEECARNRELGRKLGVGFGYAVLVGILLSLMIIVRLQLAARGWMMP